MAKVLIAIMAANNSVSQRNIAAIKRSYVETLKEMVHTGEAEHEYRVLIYSGGYGEYSCEEVVGNFLYEMKCSSLDGVYRTFEKTVEALTEFGKMYEYEYLVRANISTFINVRLLDKVVSTCDGIYCTTVNGCIMDVDYLNTLYPRGDFYITNRRIVNSILSVAGRFIVDDSQDLSNVRITAEHVDDVMFGICAKTAIGDKYNSLLHSIWYQYLPGKVSDCDASVDRLFLAYRVKSVGPGEYSGITWGDTKWRKLDPAKFDKLSELCDDFRYDGEEFDHITLNDLCIRDEETKPVVFSQLVGVELSDAKRIK